MAEIPGICQNVCPLPVALCINAVAMQPTKSNSKNIDFSICEIILTFTRLFSAHFANISREPKADMDESSARKQSHLNGSSG
ncbi:MAG: hypothetical protein ABW185_02865 [Sedimenticola sp.]